MQLHEICFGLSLFDEVGSIEIETTFMMAEPLRLAWSTSMKDWTYGMDLAMTVKKSLKVAFQMDPISAIDINGDSSFRLAE